MSDQELLLLAEQYKFDHVGTFRADILKFDPAVRSMCASGRCHSYGKRWTCPPGCGTLEEIAGRAAGYHRGILLQSTGILADDFDVDTMLETELLQKERFSLYVEQMRKQYPDCLPMSAGTCQICKKCTYPNAPCRFPELAFPSMEAYGLVVSKVCEDSGIPYYYGPSTITYSCCVLID